MFSSFAAIGSSQTLFTLEFCDMLASAVESKFPPGFKVPAPIKALCDYIDEHGYPLSGCFEISTIGDADMEAWFPGDTSMQHSFAVFGRGSTGSVYAIWLLDGIAIKDCPVVTLGSEGELLVFATDSLQFCRLLGCGYNELEWDDITLPSPEWGDAEPLRTWLANCMAIDFPKTGAKIVATARQLHPDFAELVQAWWDANT